MSCFASAIWAGTGTRQVSAYLLFILEHEAEADPPKLPKPQAMYKLSASSSRFRLGWHRDPRTARTSVFVKGEGE